MPDRSDDRELADDVVGVASARLLAAGVPAPERLGALRLLSVLGSVADTEGRVRRHLPDVAVEFGLDVDQVDAWVADLAAADVLRREGASLVLAGAEPPAAGPLRLHDFLAAVTELDEQETIQPHPTPVRMLRPAGAVLAAAALVVAVLLGSGVVTDTTTPASTTDGSAPPPGVTTTVGADELPVATTGTSRTGASRAPGTTQAGRNDVTTTTTVPCPTGPPLLEILGITTGPDGRLAVEGVARNVADRDVVIRSFTLATDVGGQEVSVPGYDGALVVPARSSVPWRASLPALTTPGAPVRARLGAWDWQGPAATSCPGPTAP